MRNFADFDDFGDGCKERKFSEFEKYKKKENEF